MIDAVATSDSRPVFPRHVRNGLRKLLGLGEPRVGRVRWADLRKTRPIGNGWGYTRGTPVDRYYIERFLDQRQADVAGHVLEVANPAYTRRFGGSRVTRSDVLDVIADNPVATIIADLNDANELPSAAFDCIILTQTLQFIYDFRAALRELERSLAPGGILLLTVPGITRVPDDCQRPWYWNFTRSSMERLIGEYFDREEMSVGTLGNIKAATAFLNGLACEDLLQAELDINDPDFPIIVTVRARKAAM